MSIPNYWSLVRIWLIYVGLGVLFGGGFYFFGGRQAAVMALAMFAIFAVIGTVVVSVALLGVLRNKNTESTKVL
jgi:hypothetical protein